MNKFGKIDTLINNGGISQYSLAIETQLEMDNKTRDLDFFWNSVSYKGCFTIQVERKSGHIVIISSLADKFGTALICIFWIMVVVKGSLYLILQKKAIFILLVLMPSLSGSMLRLC